METSDRGAGSHLDVGLTDSAALGLYRTMVLARTLDERLWSLNRMGRVAFVLSAQGHEAAQVATAAALRAGSDYALPYYRDLGVVLALGMTPLDVLLGAFARASDPSSGGRQPPGHYSDAGRRIVSGSGVVASHLPHAAGIALASRLNGTDEVAACWFGDGATSKGDFHEALNIAAVMRLPVVFVCENNGYAISVPAEKQSAVASVAERAAAYGMPGTSVDGNDALAVHGAMTAAVERARKGDGPSLLECRTYRLQPHASDDDDRYRDENERSSWRDRDPIPAMRSYLIDAGLLDDSAADELARAARTEIDGAVAEAEAAAEPTPADVRTHVTAPPATGRGRADRRSAQHGGASLRVVDALARTLGELVRADRRVVVLGEDVGRRGGVFGATAGLHQEFGDERVIDTPLAESGIVGLGIGMAIAGMRPIVELQFADFVHGAFDQLVSEAARLHYRSNGAWSLPLVVRAPWGGGVHGGLYHSQSIEAFYAHVPGLTVLAPATAADTVGLLRAAVHEAGPVLFLEHKRTYRLIEDVVPDGDWETPIGVAEVVRPGDDLTIVTYGLHRHLALEAAVALEDEISVEVVDLRTIAPLDETTVLESARKTSRVLVVHEDERFLGVGAEVAALVAEHAFYDLDAPVRRLALDGIPAMPFAPALERAASIGASDIVTAARALLRE